MPSPSSLEDHSSPAPSRGRGVLVTALGIGLLLAVAYLVAGSRDDRSEAWLGIPQLALDSFSDFAVAALLLLAIVVAVMIGRAFVVSVRSGRPDTRRSLWLSLAILFLAVIGLWMFFRLVPEETLDTLLGEVGSGPADLSEPVTPVEPDRAVAVLVWFMIMSLSVAGWFMVRWATRSRDLDLSRRDPRAELRRRRLVLVGLLDDAIAALRAHPDPREATIAAWARLETALDLVGISRRAADTPTSFLSRVLEAVDASGPAVARLTDAFERAMYSPHRIDRSTQLESVDALVAVRDELNLLERMGEPARA